LIAVLALVFGCGSPHTTTDVPVVAEPPAQAAVAFTDAKGRIQCPVMGDILSDASAATSSTTYAGKTYYFCCDACAEEFAKDPAKYADGKFLAMGGGDGDEAGAHCSDHP
jgi:YHS domain-containing protein